jgi:hypothetical protein
MKNLLNISEEEKNRILEMHTGKKNLLKEGAEITSPISNYFNGTFKVDLMSKNQQGQPFVYLTLDGDKLLATTPNKSVKEKIVDYKVLSGKLVPGQMTAVVDVNKKTLTLYSGQTLVGVIGE